jgi:hypothetical protein
VKHLVLVRPGQVVFQGLQTFDVRRTDQAVTVPTEKPHELVLHEGQWFGK